MQQEKQGGYFETIVGEHGVDVRMAQLAFAGEGPRIELFEYRSPRGGHVALRTADVGFSHVCVACDDIDAMLARLRRGRRPGGVRAGRRRHGANAGGRARLRAGSRRARPRALHTAAVADADAVRPHRHRLDALRRSARAVAAGPAAPDRDPDGRVSHRPRRRRRADPLAARARRRALRRPHLPHARRRVVRCLLRVGLPAAGRPAGRFAGRLLALPRARVGRRRGRGARAVRAAEEGGAGLARPRRRSAGRSRGAQRHRDRDGHDRLEAAARPRATSSSGSCRGPP